MLNGLDLFSGIGGLALALESYVIPRAYCENEPYAQGVLLSRMYQGKLPTAPIWDDVRTLRGEDFLGGIDIIYGGFPCQDISIARAGPGLAGERSGLFWELFRIVEESKPAFVFLENSPAIRTRGLEKLVGAFAGIGYDCRWTRISAESVGAVQERQRWFLLAHTQREFLRDEPRRRRGQSRQGAAVASDDGAQESLADADEKRRGIDQEVDSREEREQGRDSTPDSDWWAVEPGVGRVVHELPYRMDRIRALGNSVVPLQAKTAFERLMGYGARR